jgi:hypothetical protein
MLTDARRDFAKWKEEDERKARQGSAASKPGKAARGGIAMPGMGPPMGMPGAKGGGDSGMMDELLSRLNSGGSKGQSRPKARGGSTLKAAANQVMLMRTMSSKKSTLGGPGAEAEGDTANP